MSKEIKIETYQRYKINKGRIFMYKKYRKQQQTSSKVKNMLLKILKRCKNLVMSIIAIASMLSFTILPFLHDSIDHTLAQWVWFPACVIFISIAVTSRTRQSDNNGNRPVFEQFHSVAILFIFLFFGSAFIINYYHNAYNWFWAAFIIVGICVPGTLFSFRNVIIQDKSIHPKLIKVSSKTYWKYTCFYWLIDLFYMAIFNYWIEIAKNHIQLKWLVSQFVFGGLAMVFIFYNLARAFLSDSKKHWLALLHDFIFGIAITVYLIFLIPSVSNLQNIVLTIVAAVYSGLLTLVGVAWTIKDSDTKRREEERRKHIPYVRIAHNERSSVEATINTINDLDSFDRIGQEKQNDISEHSFFFVRRIFFSLKNISSDNVVLHGILIDENYYDFESTVLIEKASVCHINIGQSVIKFANKIESMHLILSDVLTNYYKIACTFEFSEINYTKTEEDQSGKNTVSKTYFCTINNFSLPEFMPEGISFANKT